MFKTNWDKKLIAAAKKNDLPKMQEAIDNGANLGDCGQKALLVATKKGSTNAVVRLLGYGVSAASKETSGQPPLIAAIANNKKQIVKILLDKGADPNAMYSGNSALYLAASKGESDSVEALIKAGAKVNFVGSAGHTAVFTAAKRGYTDVVKHLTAAGADVNITKYDDASALLWALYNKNSVEIIECLVKAGANIESRYGRYNVSKNASIHGGISMQRIRELADEVRIAKYSSTGKTPEKKAPAKLKPKPRKKVTRRKTASEKPTEVFERLSDVELLKISRSKTGVELTTIFNFQIGDIIRVQTKDGVKLSEDKTRFSDLEDTECLKPVFDKLVALKGNPPDIWRNIKTAKPVPMQGGKTGGADV